MRRLTKMRARSDDFWRCSRCGGLHSYRANGCPIPRIWRLR